MPWYTRNGEVSLVSSWWELYICYSVEAVSLRPWCSHDAVQGVLWLVSCTTPYFLQHWNCMQSGQLCTRPPAFLLQGNYFVSGHILPGGKRHLEPVLLQNLQPNQVGDTEFNLWCEGTWVKSCLPNVSYRRIRAALDFSGHHLCDFIFFLIWLMNTKPHLDKINKWSV